MGNSFVFNSSLALDQKIRFFNVVVVDDYNEEVVLKVAVMSEYTRILLHLFFALLCDPFFVS